MFLTQQVIVGNGEKCTLGENINPQKLIISSKDF